jgi:hypothetical protein
MVGGLRRFADHFRGFEDSYVLIGGAACDLWLSDRGVPFRATRDLDLVLVVEAIRPAFMDRFWAFIRDGRYRSHQESSARPSFYRFKDPQAAGFPVMIELLTRNLLDLAPGIHLTPIPAEEDVSSLSAILLDESYYRFVVDSRVLVDGIPLIPAQCLIPLKARAWLDLTARQVSGDRTVKTSDIKKHRADIFRLYRSLRPADRFPLPARLSEDLRQFLDRFPPGSPDWPMIAQAVGNPPLPAPADVVRQLREIFQVGE